MTACRSETSMVAQCEDWPSSTSKCVCTTSTCTRIVDDVILLMRDGKVPSLPFDIPLQHASPRIPR